MLDPVRLLSQIHQAQLWIAGIDEQDAVPAAAPNADQVRLFRESLATARLHASGFLPEGWMPSPDLLRAFSERIAAERSEERWPP